RLHLQELRFGHCDSVRCPESLAAVGSVKLQHGISMGTVVQRILRHPKVRAVKHLRCRYEGLFSHPNPLIQVAGGPRQIVAESGIAAVSDTPSLETPDPMRIVDHH